MRSDSSRNTARSQAHDPCAARKGRWMDAVLPAAASHRAQLAMAASSALIIGVVAYVIVRYFIA